MRERGCFGVLPMLAAVASCGDGATSSGGIVPPNGTNVAAVVVDAGPRGANGSPVGYVNGLFTTVTVCIPGTSTCQDIDHVLVDTGSAGLRLLANDGIAGGELSLALPPQRDTSGNAIVECTQFLDGFTWGPVALADVQLAGEKATRVPIQVISEKTFDHGFGFHTGFGYFIFLGAVVLLLLALVARLGKRRILFSLAVPVAVAVQIVLAWISESVHGVGILHGLNALVIFGLTGYLNGQAWRSARGAARVAPAA